MDGILTLSSKNQLTLPVGVVSSLGLVKGSKIWIKVKTNTIVLEKVNDSWDDLHGFLADHPMSKKYSMRPNKQNQSDRDSKMLFRPK